MSKPVASPTRLVHLTETEDARGVGRMFRGALELPDEDLPKLRWRLRTSLRLRAMRPRLVMKVALVVGIVFCMGGIVGAVVSPFLAGKGPAVVAVATPAAARAVRPRKRRPVSSAPATPTLFDPVPDDHIEPITCEPGPMPAEQPRPVAAPAKHRAPVRLAMLDQPAPPAPPAPPPAPAPPGDAPETAPPPVVPPSAIAVEQSLLGQAMRTLREGHDARTALALLAQHAERFPGGALTSEATMLRIEALLALGRRDEALSALDTVPLASLPNRDEQLVVRGELRAAKQRWREAEQDFDETLQQRDLPAATAKARNIQERALWGRAAARSRLGNQNGARADLGLYLLHFPGGRFAGPAASLLKVAP